MPQPPVVNNTGQTPPKGGTSLADNPAGRAILSIYRDRFGKSQSTDYYLPIPKGFNDVFDNNWEANEFGKTFGAAIKAAETGDSSVLGALLKGGSLEAIKGVSEMTTSFGTFNTTEIAMSGLDALMYFQKNAVNPYTRLMYKSPNLRNWQFTWSLKPKNEQEAKSINDMIHDIRTSSYPEISTSGTGSSIISMFVYPRDFSITIIGGGSGASGKVLLKSLACGCTSVQVNYDTAGNVYTHSDGYPVTTTITISLQEHALLERPVVDKLYKS